MEKIVAVENFFQGIGKITPLVGLKQEMGRRRRRADSGRTGLEFLGGFGTKCMTN
jgi:hypothetical protein